MRTIYLPLVLMAALCLAQPAAADVDVNVNIGLPVLTVAPDPFLAVIPGTYVYFVVDLEGDIFFYQGYWWRAHKGRWHRSAAAAGPWLFFKVAPAPLLNLPPGWRKLPPGHAKFRFNEVKKNWKQWEKEKRWDKKPDKAPEQKAKPAAVKNEGKPKAKSGGKPKGGKGR